MPVITLTLSHSLLPESLACVRAHARAQALQDTSSPAEPETLTIKNTFPPSFDFLSLKQQIICIYTTVNN